MIDREWSQDGPGRLIRELPEPWPWRGRVRQTFTLTEARADFTLELEADEPMPAAIGWHPWFATWLTRSTGERVGPLELDLAPGAMYANDADGLPTGELVPPPPRPWDYCFRGMQRPPVVRWPGALELVVESDCPDWVIYDQEPQGICVEPWTAPPNSVNMPDPTVVEPGRPLVAGMTWRWRRAGDVPATPRPEAARAGTGNVSKDS